MSKRTIILSAVLLFSFGLMCAANVPATRLRHAATENGQRQGQSRDHSVDCADGRAVANAIYAHLRKNGFRKQINQINAFFNTSTKVITLSGFIAPTSRNPNQRLVRINRAGELALEATTCESKLENRLTSLRGQECTFPLQPCGQTGVCLPANECTAGGGRR